MTHAYMHTYACVVGPLYRL